MSDTVRSPEKAKMLDTIVEHIDIKSFDARPIIDQMEKMSFTSRDLARATRILNMAIDDPECSIILTLAGSTSAGGCMDVYRDMVELGIVDAVVSTGASIVDMDFFEALGFKHYHGDQMVDDGMLRANMIDRIYDTYIDEDELQVCDQIIKDIADSLKPGVYSSREFIYEMGRWLKTNAKKKNSLIECCFDNDVPIFVPAFSDCSAGFGLVKHQVERPEAHVSIDSVKDFRELTDLKIKAGTTGLFMVGGGVPKNFVQDTVVCAEILGVEADMHKYAVQITVADPRDGACSSSTLKEANSWGKVDLAWEQMVYAEASSVVPLMLSDAYHRGGWKKRTKKQFTKLFQG